MNSWISVWTAGYDGALTEAQRQNNAGRIAAFFGPSKMNWSLAAIAGMLGNMEYESFLNPAQWQIGYSPEYWPPAGVGYGLVQWTPWTKFSDWGGANWRTDHDLQLYKIRDEFLNGQQWIVTEAFPYTWEYYSTIQTTPEHAAQIWEFNYERGTWSDQRSANARKWYNWLIDNPPGEWDPDTPTPGRIPIWLLFKFKGRGKRGENSWMDP